MMHFTSTLHFLHRAAELKIHRIVEFRLCHPATQIANKRLKSHKSLRVMKWQTMLPENGYEMMIEIKLDDDPTLKRLKIVRRVVVPRNGPFETMTE